MYTNNITSKYRLELLINRYIKYKKKEDFALIYRKYVDDLYRFILSRCGNIQTSEEVVSDTFFSLIELIGKFDSTKSKFRTFLFGIALNKLRQRWDKEKVNKFFSLDEDIELEDNYTPSIKRSNLFFKIEKAIKKLSVNQIQVITKRFFEMKSIKIVAKELNISISNVTTLQNRAVNKLREIVSEEESN